MGKKSKKLILVASGTGIFLLIALFLLRDNIITMLYYTDFFHPSFENLQIDEDHDINIFNFQLSVNDMQFLNNNARMSSTGIKNWQEVDLQINDKMFRVEISHFYNYFYNLQPVQSNQPLSIRFPDNDYFDFVSVYDLFRLQEIDLFEQELVYDLGKRLHLFIPKTMYVQILFDYTNNGLYTLKQSFDKVFLDQLYLEDSIIAMLYKTEADEYSIKYLYDEELDDETEIHLEQFLQHLKNGDKKMLFEYFDLDYLSRFETLRILLNAGMEFVMAENLRFIYSKERGKLYPILDEANILNMRKKGKDKSLEIITRLIKENPVIQQKIKNNLGRLTSQYNEIILSHKKSLKKFKRLLNHMIYRLKINLVSDFFSKNVYKKIKRISNPQKQKTRKFSFPPPSAITKFHNLNESFTNPVMIVKDHPDLNLEIKNGHFVLSAGIHILKKTIIIPRGRELKIMAGARIMVYPRISLICYSPVYITGTRENPVIIEASETDNPFGVFAFIGPHQKPSEIAFLDFSGSSNATNSGSTFSGGLYLQDMDIKIYHTKIHHSHSDSSMTANGCSISLKNNRFQENDSDHISLKNTWGTVRENLFYYGGEQTTVDGIKVVHSNLLVQENQFERLPDKGIIISQDSNCIFYNNRFRFNRMGLAIKDSSSAVVFSNTFSDNQIGISSYQKNPAFEGGKLYLMENSFENNESNLIVDRCSSLFLLQNYPDLPNKILETIDENTEYNVMPIFKKLKNQFPIHKNQFKDLKIGIHQAQINERDRIIFVHIPTGSDTAQKISFETRLKNSSVYLKPVLRGIHHSTKIKAEKILNNSIYDFKNFIFFGKINLIRDYLSKEYDLFITDSLLSLLSINSANKSGQINEIKNEPKIPCTICYFSSNPKSSLPIIPQTFNARIEGRGQKWPKWKYGFILDRAAKLEGLDHAKKWVLESSFVEKSLMRSKITFDLLKQFSTDPNQPKIAPSSRFIEVILNHDYQGIYLLTEHIDKNFLNLEDFDKNEEYNAILYRAKNRNANFTSINTEPEKNNVYKYFPGEKQPEQKDKDPIMGWHSGFAQRHPDPDQFGEYWEPIEELTKFIALSSDEIFEQNIFDILNMDNFLNLWILIQLTDDTDGIFQNRYVARSRGKKSKWYFIPWDKDGVFGRNFKMEKRPYNKWLSSPFFDRCLKLDIFKNLLIKRWQELTNTGIISTENIFKMIEENKKRLKNSWKRNSQKWAVVAPLYPDNMDFNQEIEYLKTWISKRIIWLDEYFENLAKGRPE